jgi:acetylornithine deacetylase/succinyl-diaminopimelate desuccinylase-like protein
MTTTTHSQLELETIRICQELIRIPSVNFGEGKGDEKDVAAHVVALLSEVGIQSQTYESARGRCNVIARIKGSNSNRPG